MKLDVLSAYNLVSFYQLHLEVGFLEVSRQFGEIIMLLDLWQHQMISILHDFLGKVFALPGQCPNISSKQLHTYPAQLCLI